MKRLRFQLALILIAGLELARPAVAGQRDSSLVAREKVSQLQSRVAGCLSGGCSSDPQVLWVLSRVSGTSRIIRALNPRPQWMDESEHRGLLATLGALPPPEPRLATDPPELMHLDAGSRIHETVIALEHATGYPGERLISVLSPQRYFRDALSSGATSRTWILTSDGEVLAQSDGHFLGSRFGDRSIFRARREDRPGTSAKSFDGLEVRPRWTELSGVPLVILEEQILDESRSAPWNIMQLLRGAGIIVAGVLLVAMANFSRGLLRRLRPAKEIPLPAEMLHQAIYRSRHLRELGTNLSECLAQITGSEVLYLEFDRNTGIVSEIGAGVDGVHAVLSEVGLTPGRTLPEIPSLRSSVIRRRDTASFLAWPLMAASTRPVLLGVVLVLRPTARVRASASSIGVWVERAARYYRSILSPENPEPSRHV
jgi:hypothetical protein